MSDPSVYGESFYADRTGSRRSAQVVVPMLVDLLHPSSVVDVGCGTGGWLAELTAHGVMDVVGVDGEHVPRELLEIPEERFVVHDLRTPLDLGRRFDLALCLEVAEHLPPETASVLVASLTALSSLVLFSAAIPDQHGEGHVNEQWQDWWADLFAAQGYVAVDALRRPLWQRDDVEWWYAQNMLLYAEPEALERHPALREAWERTIPEQLAIVHPRGYLSFRNASLRDRLLTLVRRR